jgi:hypothetical protein
MEKYFGDKLTVYLPSNLHDRMKKFPEIRWSAVARSLVEKYVEKLEKGEDVHSWTKV